MVDIDATTSQMKAIKVMRDCFNSRDLRDLKPLISEDFVFKTFPKTPELADLNKEEYLLMYGTSFSSFAKVELIFHELIEAPGKVVTHHKFIFTTDDGRVFDYDASAIVTFVEEDGEVRFLDAKDFCDPQKRGIVHAEVAKIQGRLVA